MKGVTVIIPVYNQAFPLTLTLQGFTKQKVVQESIEIIVVDNGSTEPIESIVEAYRGQLNIRYIKLERGGEALARNIGATAAQGEILIFSDADRVPCPCFVYEHIQAQKQAKGAFVVGHVRELHMLNAAQSRTQIMTNYLDENKTRVPQYCSIVYSLFNSEGFSTTGVPWVAALSGNMSIPLEAYHIIGGFDEYFLRCGFEIFEFGYRAHLEKLPFYYASEAINVHIAPRRIRANEREQIKKSHLYFFSKHRSFVVKKFLDFMLGELGITQLEEAVNSYILSNMDKS